MKMTYFLLKIDMTLINKQYKIIIYYCHNDARAIIVEHNICDDSR